MKTNFEKNVSIGKKLNWQGTNSFDQWQNILKDNEQTDHGIDLEEDELILPVSEPGTYEGKVYTMRILLSQSQLLKNNPNLKEPIA